MFQFPFVRLAHRFCRHYGSLAVSCGYQTTESSYPLARTFTRQFASDRGVVGRQSSPRNRKIADDVKEYKEAVKNGNLAEFDKCLIPISEAHIFPRIKTTSLSTKRIVIHDESTKTPVTLVLVAFRSFADNQLSSWRTPFSEKFPEGQWFDVTVNESFSAQALSGFVQRWQRGRTDQALHDYFVSFNDRAREPLESLLLARNRMYGYVLLLDRQARVRFRGSGMANSEAIDTLSTSCREILTEEERADNSM